jgi:hypothetical protein
MGASEFVTWAAYLSIQPGSEQRADLRNAMLMTLLANANRDRKRHPKPFTVNEFMPDWWKPEEKPLTGQQILSKFAALVGGTDGEHA